MTNDNKLKDDLQALLGKATGQHEMSRGEIIDALEEFSDELKDEKYDRYFEIRSGEDTRD